MEKSKEKRKCTHIQHRKMGFKSSKWIKLGVHFYYFILKNNNNNNQKGLNIRIIGTKSQTPSFLLLFN